MLWSVKYFKHIVYGTISKLITGHKALECLNSGEIELLRIQKWLASYQILIMKLEYKKDSEILRVDYLSRNYVDEVKDKKDVNGEVADEQKEKCGIINHMSFIISFVINIYFHLIFLIKKKNNYFLINYLT